jgi:hypothetical protein
MNHYEKRKNFGGLLATELGNIDVDWDIDGPDVVKDRNAKTVHQWLSSSAPQPSMAEVPEGSDAS